mgnify:CR=1 FL=1
MKKKFKFTGKAPRLLNGRKVMPGETIELDLTKNQKMTAPGFEPVKAAAEKEKGEIK